MSKIDILKNGGVLLVPGQLVEEIIDHPQKYAVQCPPRVPQSLMQMARDETYHIKFRTDEEGLLVYQNMEHLMQEYVLYFIPEMIFKTIQRSCQVLQPDEQKILLSGLKKITEEIESEILRKS